MTKKVRYNGMRMSCYSCDDPANLVVGKEYEVIAEKDRGWQTDYRLKGVKGEFNSCWFDEIKTFVAFSSTIPTVGDRCRCFVLKVVDGEQIVQAVTTSTAKKVVDMGNDIYDVMTRNNRYIIQLVM